MAIDHIKVFEMTNQSLLKTGIIGSVIAVICCFTPILVVLFSVVGLSTLVGWLDYVLFPALFFFLVITAYAIFKRQKSSGVA